MDQHEKRHNSDLHNNFKDSYIQMAKYLEDIRLRETEIERLRDHIGQLVKQNNQLSEAHGKLKEYLKNLNGIIKGMPSNEQTEQAIKKLDEMRGYIDPLRGYYPT